MRLLGLLVCVVLVACITDPTPGRSPYCLYKGDTVGVLRRLDATNTTVTECIWILADADECFRDRVQFKGIACAVGDQWP